MSSQVEADLKELAESSARGLPTLDQTARAVADARAHRTGGSIMSKIIGRPLWTTAAGIAVVAAILVCPVPYTRTVGYELTVANAAGRVARIRVPAKSAAVAERRAAELRKNGATVTVAARTERVWGSVYAMAKEKLLDVHVDLDGKTDQQVADDIRSQLAAGGWTADDVQVQRSGDSSSVELSAEDADGRKMKVVRKASGGNEKSLDFQVGGLDDEREPGMTDAQLRDKILKQLQARGLDGDVTVDGDRIQIQAKRTMQVDQ
ncbi:MAG TPA: hypothetical protein VN947_09330 [Polyangia bacterium]|nr:hypothetical protein [Polyangia bacterium]